MGNKFEVKCKNEFHNYFEIEVIENGKVVQKAYAQNIVLNNAFMTEEYTIKILALTPNRLLIGSGTGVLSNTRGSLFNKVSELSALQDTRTIEVQKYTTTVVQTMKFKLEISANIGITFTELGISYYGRTMYDYDPVTRPLTHALLKDADGNNVSILKTATNEIYFTATLFYKMQLLNPATTFIETPSLYACSNIATHCDRKLNTSKIEFRNPDNYFVSSNVLYDLPNDPGLKRINNGNSFTLKQRFYFDVTKANYDIRTLFLGTKNVIADLTNISIWQGYDVQAETLFIGDSVVTEKTIEHDNISNVVVKVDGVIDETVAITDVDSWLRLLTRVDSLASKISDKVLVINFMRLDYYNTYHQYLLVKTSDGFNGFVTPNNIKVAKVTENGRYFKATNNTFFRFNSNNEGAIQIQENEVEGILLDVEPITQGEIWNGYKVQNGGIYEPSTRKKVSFPIAPPAGAKITVDYHAPYVPKTSDYIFVVEVTETWNEGVQ